MCSNVSSVEPSLNISLTYFTTPTPGGTSHGLAGEREPDSGRETGFPGLDSDLASSVERKLEPGPEEIFRKAAAGEILLDGIVAQPSGPEFAGPPEINPTKVQP